MIRTQIQLPDRLHRALKAIAVREETSLAEIMRRAGEYFLVVHPRPLDQMEAWEPPGPQDLGEIVAPESEWRLMANEPSAHDLREDAAVQP